MDKSGVDRNDPCGLWEITENLVPWGFTGHDKSGCVHEMPAGLGQVNDKIVLGAICT